MHTNSLPGFALIPLGAGKPPSAIKRAALLLVANLRKRPQRGAVSAGAAIPHRTVIGGKRARWTNPNSRGTEGSKQTVLMRFCECPN